ncbi:hypothetical protein EOD42_14315 [Rhodovarius crocodyli]|uniref:Uncharacterized protein n=1 Tax=Rhodovarius crocodyli TaxID=1979269 RepID=A0A437MF81_9PROT|nr:hypothetical protein [Rhodovarius crocodyli]RVT96282.1 hypothetical protein EOD42_14315 [Rhodovarius crocodyli]
MEFLPHALRQIFSAGAAKTIAIHDATDQAWGIPRLALMVPGVHSIILPATEAACQFAAKLAPGAVLISYNLEASVAKLNSHLRA